MIDLGEEMEELFVPFMTFFHQPRTTPEAFNELEENSLSPAFVVAVYSLIANFNENRI